MPRPLRASTANLSADSAAAAPGPDSRPPLPPRWKWTTLGEVCELRTGTRDPGQSPDAPFLYVDISSVDNKRKRITEAKRLLGKGAPSRARQVIKTGDVLVATTRPNLNAVALVPPELNDQIASTGFCILRNTVEVLPEFLFSFVQTPTFVEALSDLVKGALYPAVTDKQVLRQLIPLPPLAEQRRIVAGLRERLDTVERARAAAAAQLEAANALPAACLRKLFTSPGAQQWPKKKMGDICRFWGGSSLPPGEPFIGQKEGYLLVKVGEMNLERNETYLKESREWCALPSASSSVVPCNVIVIPKRGGAILTNKKRITTRISILDPNLMGIEVIAELLDPEYLFQWFCLFDLATITSGSTVLQLNKKDLTPLIIPTPSLATQRRIAAELKEKVAGAEALRSSLAAQLAGLDALPAAYLRQAFAGEF